MLKRFQDLEIGTKFMCAKGKFIKIRNGSDYYNGNAKRLLFGEMINIQGKMMCEVLGK